MYSNIGMSSNLMFRHVKLWLLLLVECWLHTHTHTQMCLVFFLNEVVQNIG